MRKWIIPLAVLLVVPALGAAAPIVQPFETETLVEGHTVFTVIEQTNRNESNVEEYGAAVAVLVREATQNSASFRFPGVLWFNDQYLVNPYSTPNADIDYRFPCTGAVMAVNSGDPDPATTLPTAGYIESYTITDPNDHTWIVDKWLDASGPIWVVAILNNGAGLGVADDGVSSCAPVDEGERSLPLCPTGTGGASGQMGLQPLRCNDGEYTGTNGNAVSYNALLYFVLADLDVAGGVKDHNVGSADYTADKSGCHDTDPLYGTDEGPSPTSPSDAGGQPDPAWNPQTDPMGGFHPTLTGRDDSTATENRGRWECPNGDDNAEGNSHPYNPFAAGLVCPNCAGASGGHGGSGGGANLHATRNVDIYYGTAPTPTARTMVITDLEGSTAPYNCVDNPAVPGGCSELGPAPFGADTYRN